MSRAGEAIRRHHGKIRAILSQHVTALREGRAEADPQALAAFLQEDLLPHAVGEEKALYPAVDPLIKAYGKATATMSVDHEFIEGSIRRIVQAVQEWAQAEEAEKATRFATLRDLALQLEAVLTLHLEKEERVYLPLFEEHLPEEEQERVLHAMHEAHGHESEQALDVRALPPRERHPLIMRTFDALKPGQSFILVNDHDPKPLYYQFQFERAGEFTWEYLEEGPEVWRVRIGRA